MPACAWERRSLHQDVGVAVSIEGRLQVCYISKVMVSTRTTTTG